MMPLDARFTSLPIPANDTRAPDEGDAARSGNTPFAGLLDEMGRGTRLATETPQESADESANPRGQAQAGSSATDGEEPLPAGAGADPADSGTVLSRLIARALARPGAPVSGAARFGAAAGGVALPQAMNDARQVGDGTASSPAPWPMGSEERLQTRACAAGASPSPAEAVLTAARSDASRSGATLRETMELASAGMTATELDTKELDMTAPDATGSDAEGQDSAKQDSAGRDMSPFGATGVAANHMAAGSLGQLLVCVAPSSAGRPDGAQASDGQPDTPASPTGGGVALADGPEETLDETPRLVAKVLDVQTHFAPIRSLTSGPLSPAAVQMETEVQAQFEASVEAKRLDASASALRAQSALGDGRANDPARTGTQGSPAAASPVAVSPPTVPSAPPAPSASPAPIAPQAASAALPAAGGTGVAPPSGPVPAPVAAMGDMSTGEAASLTDVAEARDTADAQGAALASGALPERQPRRAEPAGSGAVKTADPAFAPHPSDPPAATLPAGERRGGREERDERGAPPAPSPVSADASAGRAGAGTAGPASGTVTALPSPGTAAVAGALSEAASRLVRANAGADLSAAPRPGDPVRIMELALSPEGLGKVTVRLRLTSDGLEVRVRAADAGTAALLQQDKAQLAGILREFGCSEDRMEVSGPDGSAIGPSTGPDLRTTQASPGDDRRGDPQGDRSQGGSQDGSRRNEGRHDDQGSRNSGRGGARDAGFDLRLDGGLDGGLLDG